MDYNELRQDNFLSSCGVVHTYNTSTQADPKLVRGQSKLHKSGLPLRTSKYPLLSACTLTYSRPLPPRTSRRWTTLLIRDRLYLSLGFLKHLLDQVNLQPVIMRAWLLYTCPAYHWWENKVPLELGTWIQGRKEDSYSPQSRQISGLQ